MNIFVFDIETIPDLENARKIYNLVDFTEDEAYSALLNIRATQTGGSDFMPLHLHKIVAISAVLHSGTTLKVWSLGEPDSTEKELIERFYAGIEKYTPTLISWNGGGFDLPVLHYRALLHSVSAPMYWETGESHSPFKWNNYLSRFHARHTDLMDVLAGYQMRANAPLDQIATMLGFPGKMGMHGSKVLSAYRDGDIEGIRNYCETDVLNTYLVFLRFELMRGHLNAKNVAEYHQMLREHLTHLEKPHFDEFLQAWKSNS